MQYSITFRSRPEAASNVISGKFVWLIVSNKAAKFYDHHLSSAEEIWLKGAIFLATVADQM